MVAKKTWDKHFHGRKRHFLPKSRQLDILKQVTQLVTSKPFIFFKIPISSRRTDITNCGKHRFAMSAENICPDANFKLINNNRGCQCLSVLNYLCRHLIIILTYPDAWMSTTFLISGKIKDNWAHKCRITIRMLRIIAVGLVEPSKFWQAVLINVLVLGYDVFTIADPGTKSFKSSSRFNSK